MMEKLQTNYKQRKMYSSFEVFVRGKKKKEQDGGCTGL